MKRQTELTVAAGERLMTETDFQRMIAEASCGAAAKTYTKPMTTEVVPLEKFWTAEDYHQDYFAKHPEQGYCAFVIAPKVRKLEKMLEEPT